MFSWSLLFPDVVRQTLGATVEIGEEAQDHDYVPLDITERSISPENPIYPYECSGFAALNGMDHNLL